MGTRSPILPCMLSLNSITHKIINSLSCNRVMGVRAMGSLCGLNGPDQPHLRPPQTRTGWGLFNLSPETFWPMVKACCWSLVLPQLCLCLIMDAVDLEHNLQDDFSAMNLSDDCGGTFWCRLCFTVFPCLGSVVAPKALSTWESPPVPWPLGSFQPAQYPNNRSLGFLTQ